jgi:hypothetical protein
MILETSNQIQQAVIILKLQMNIPVSILVRSLNLTNCFYKEKGFGSCLSVKECRVGWELEIYLAQTPHFLNFKINGVQMAVLTLWEENNPCVGMSKSVLSLIMVY